MEGVGLDSAVGALQITSPTATGGGRSTFRLFNCRCGIHGYELLGSMQHANKHRLMVSKFAAGCIIPVAGWLLLQDS